MALSQDLINQFAKLTVKEEKPTETTVNGTYKTIDGVEYVQIDGSEIWTPVTSTVEAETGERVKVTIKNHTATVTGNISSPSARSKSVQDLKDEVDEYGNTIQQLDNTIEQQGNSITQINNNIQQVNNTISQHDNAISQHGNTIQQINNTIQQQGNDITQLNNDIEQQGNDITQINNTLTQHGNTITQHGNTITQQGNTISQQGNTIQQQGNTISQQGNTISQHGTALNTINSNISILNSAFVIENGVLTGLSEIVVDELETNTLNAKYANIDFTNINFAAVRKVFSDSGIIKDLVVQSGKITGELVGVTIKGDLIEGNTVKAEKLVVKGEDGLYYKLNIDGLDNISTTQASKFTLTTSQPSDWTDDYKNYYVISNGNYVHVSGNSAPTWAANTYYKLNTDHQNGLDGTIIIAKSITADKVQVSDLVAFDATIGGFHIGDHSLYSGVKSTVNNTTRGVYLDDSGQVNIGDSNNFIKYFLDTTDNTYKLQISAGSIKMGGSNKTLQETIDEIESNVDNIQVGGRNLLLKTREFTKGNPVSTLTNETYNECYIRTLDISSLTSGYKEFFNWNRIRANHKIDFKAGDIYTFSFWIKGTKTETASNNGIECYFYGESGYAKVKVINSPNGPSEGGYNDGMYRMSLNNFITDKWKRAWVVWEIDPNATDSEIAVDKHILIRQWCGWNIQVAGAKLEKGNIPTDWLPSPEDVDNNITDAVNGIQIGGRNLLKYTDYSNINYMRGIWIRDNYVAPAQSTDIPEGGSKNSLRLVTSQPAVSGTRDVWQKCWNKQIVNENIRLSLYIKGSVACKAFFRLAGAASSNSSHNFQYDITTSWTKLEINLGKVTLSGANDQTEIIYGFNAAGTFYINSMKLEYGDKFTDWTPAPEDVDDTIAKTVKQVDVEYYLSTSSSSTTDGSWSTTAPAWVDGKYMWSRQKVTYVDDTTATRNETCIAGAKGETGSPGGTGATGTGVESITEEYYLSTSKTSQTGSSWVTTPPSWSVGKYIWTRSKIVYKNPSSTVYTTPLCSSEWEAINDVEIGGRNLILNSNFSKDDKSKYGEENCVSTILHNDPIYGSYIKVTFSQAGRIYYNTTNVWVNGQQYGISFMIKTDDENVAIVPSRSLADYAKTMNVTTTWQRYTGIINSTLTATAGTVSFSVNKACVIYITLIKLEKGNKCTDWSPAPEDVDNMIAKTVKQVDVEYYLSTSSTSVTGGSWSTTAPAWVDGKYMWSRQKVTYVDNTTATRNQTCIAGAKGATGGTGTGVDSITEEYYLSTSKSSQTGGSWVTTPPTWSTGKYIWTRSKIVYKNPASTVYTTPVCSSEWEAINDVEIGGRNLWLNTGNFAAISGKFGYVGNPYDITNNQDDNTLPSGKYLSFKIPVVTQDTQTGLYYHAPNNIKSLSIMKQNEIYTVSYYVNVSKQIKIRPNSLAESQTIISSNYSTDQYIEPGWKRVIVTFKYTNTNKMTSCFYFTKESSDTDITTIKIACPKLEMGNKPTDWTPAPEDIYGSIDNIQVGGTNRIIGSIKYREDTPYKIENTTANDSYKILTDLKVTPIPGEWYILQVKCDKPVSPRHGYAGDTKGKFALFLYLRNIGSTQPDGSFDVAQQFTGTSNYETLKYLGNKNNTYYWSYKIPNNTRDIIVRVNTYASTDEPVTISWWDFKMEQGNKPTDWTPAPEDVDSSIGDVQTVALGAQSTAELAKTVANQATVDINSIKGYIQNLVVDQNGQSMMTQTGSGWQFNMGTINGNLDSLSRAVDDMSDDNQATRALLNNVKSLAESVADKTAYINVDYTTDASGNPIPRMILGAETSAFKIRITNESIDFMESDTVMAYATSNTFYNLTTVVQKELEIGSGPSFVWTVRSNGNLGLTYKS